MSMAWVLKRRLNWSRMDMITIFQRPLNKEKKMAEKPTIILLHVTR